MPTFAQDDPFFEQVGSWTIVAVNGMCLAAQKQHSQPTLSLAGTAEGKYHVVLFYNSGAKFIQENRTYGVTVMLGNNIGFGGIATGGLSPNGSHSLTFRNMPSGNIDAFAKSNAITVKTYDNQRLPAVSLKGAAKMIASLRRCMKNRL